MGHKLSQIVSIKRLSREIGGRVGELGTNGVGLAAEPSELPK